MLYIIYSIHIPVICLERQASDKPPRELGRLLEEDAGCRGRYRLVEYREEDTISELLDTVSHIIKQTS